VNRALWLLRRHGAPVALAAGGVLGAAALAVQWTVLPPLQARIEALRADAGRDVPARRALERPDGARARLAAFYGYFDRPERLTDHLGALYAAGLQAGIEFKRAEYRLASSPERRLDRYQIVLPVRGSYPAIRGFIAETLRALPTASLDQVQFQRREVGEAAVDAQLVFTLHLAR
jgi:hypothetical protein